uniref:Endonuclease/exonuclease/phosphatase domain-containing protein n=2 Tax=Rhodosorus marinus TaxID=101924 RepID=A0A7S2ZUU9_9RHOD|mmetsp:Transcript_33488/g.132100  ORF Transcript_33488/g.132100 Transcript_33488/m.132100 type:complete len:468 (+) Transcript_33488:238-1641(+)
MMVKGLRPPIGFIVQSPMNLMRCFYPGALGSSWSNRFQRQMTMLKAVGPGKPPPPNVNWRGDWGGQPGDRGSGGDRLLAHMRETDNVRSGRTNLDRDSATYTRFVSYNVLSSSLSTPTTFPECDPDALLEENRLQKLTIKLEREITFRSVVCLQEVSIKWSGALHTFFSKNGYHFVFSGYGNRFNGYMGVGIAVPVHDFDILDVDLTRVADVKQWPRSPKEELSGISKVWKDFTSTRLGKAMFPQERPPDSAYVGARKRHNIVVFARLRSKRNGHVVCVANYHMPCAYMQQGLMVIHLSLVVNQVQKLCGEDPVVFCGDFNMQPDQGLYKMVVEGIVPEDLDPEVPAYDSWLPTAPEKLLSTYKEFTGSEPEFTNYAKTGDKPEFCATLDYIFISPDLEVVDVESLPTQEEVAGPLPNEEEPSDHLLIAATIRISDKQEKKPENEGKDKQGESISDSEAEPNEENNA